MTKKKKKLGLAIDTLNTTHDVLQQLNLINYFPTFKENYLTDDIVSELTLSELEEIMKPLGHRKLFLKKFALEFKKGSPSSQNEQKEVSLVTSVTTTTTAHHVGGDVTVGRDINTEMVSTKIQNITNVLEAPESPITSFRLLPSPNPHFSGRIKLIDQLRSVFLKMEVEGQVANIHSRVLLLTGMSGIGKTEIAQKYADTFCKEHGSVAWMRADSLQSIASSFLSLAKELKLVSVLQANISASQMSSDQLQEMTRTVYSHFSKHVRKGLIIFDGVSSSSSDPGVSFNIEDFLPGHHQDHFPLILITSREHSWTFPVASSHRIHVPQWTLEDSLKFLNNQFQALLQKKHSDCGKSSMEGMLRKLHEIFEGYPRGLAKATTSVLNSISASEGDVQFDTVLSSYCDKTLVPHSKECHEIRNSFSTLLSTTFPKYTESGENKEVELQVLVLMSFLPLQHLVFQDVVALYALMHEQKTHRSNYSCVSSEGRTTAAVVAFGADRARKSILLLHNLSLIYIVADLDEGKKIQIHPAFHKYIRESVGREESHFGLHGISTCLQTNMADPRWRPLLYPIHRALLAQKYSPKQIPKKAGAIPLALEYSLVAATCLNYWKDHDTASQIVEDVTNSPELPDRSPLKEGLNGIIFDLHTMKYLKSQPREILPSEDKCILLSLLEIYAQNKGVIPRSELFKVTPYCRLFRQLLATDFRASEIEKDFQKQVRIIKYVQEIWDILYPIIHQEPFSPAKEELYRIVLLTCVPSQSSEVDPQVERFISLSTQKWWRGYFEFLKAPRSRIDDREAIFWKTVVELFPYKLQGVPGNDHFWCIEAQFFESFVEEQGSSVVLQSLQSQWAKDLDFKPLINFHHFLLLLVRALSEKSLRLLLKDVGEALYRFSCRVMTESDRLVSSNFRGAIQCTCLHVYWIIFFEKPLEISEQKTEAKNLTKTNDSNSNSQSCFSLQQFVVDSKFKDWLDTFPLIEKSIQNFGVSLFRSIYKEEVRVLENILEVLVSNMSLDGEEPENSHSSQMEKVHHFTQPLRKLIDEDRQLVESRILKIIKDILTT